MTITVDIPQQVLTLETKAGKRKWQVSTALKGPGQKSGSEQTPLGRHYIRARIGDGLPARAVLRGRRFTGEVWTPELHQKYPGKDWVLGRVLWLCGAEPGFNRLGSVDSQRRYIYIHGTPDCESMGVPRSHGCIRMNCDDLLELYPLTVAGMEVIIR